MMYGPWNGGWWGVGMMFMSLLFLGLIVVASCSSSGPSRRAGRRGPDRTGAARSTSWPSGSPEARSTSRNTRSGGVP